MTVVSSLNSASDVEKYGFHQRDIGKGGLKKQILRKGTSSWQTPLYGDEVHVQFSGQIQDGTLLHDKVTSFKFKLGQCEVISGWDEGVATMKKGERAIFVIPPKLGYGEAGFAGAMIPPNSCLIFDIELISWTSIRDLTADGGILKTILREGDGWATPRHGDQVFVKYEARIEDGTVVSKSSEGIEFQTSNAFLCPAMSIAVKTMRRNEKSELTVRFSYGSRENVKRPESINDGGVTRNHIVSIELELVSWKSVVDVTGDKNVLKRIVEAGEGFDHPNEGSIVKVAYVAKNEDGSVIDSKGSTEEPFEFVTLQEQINEGLDRAIMTMKKGERSIVTVNTKSRPEQCDPSANSFISYEVQLFDFTKEKPYWKMDCKEKLEASERKKNDGNLLFKAGNFWHASKKYEKAAKYLEFDHSFSDEEKTLANALRLSCYLNNAACRLRLGEYGEAVKLCTKVLELDPTNAKALYRRSQAYLKVSDLEKAEADISSALSIHPRDREMRVLQKELKEKQKEYKMYQAEMSRTILSKMV